MQMPREGLVRLLTKFDSLQRWAVRRLAQAATCYTRPATSEGIMEVGKDSTASTCPQLSTGMGEAGPSSTLMAESHFRSVVSYTEPLWGSDSGASSSQGGARQFGGPATGSDWGIFVESTMGNATLAG